MPATQEINLNNNLLEKYSVSIPRYTSYPTAPEWSENFTKEDFSDAINCGNEKKSPLSLYFHLPFCESQCYFCACNVVISKERKVLDPYLASIKKEIENSAKNISKDRKVEQIHFGGGTPTYLTPYELSDLFIFIQNNFNIADDCEISIEIDPRVTSQEHIKELSKSGFNRLSMGIQDFNEGVQNAINRVQPFNETQNIFNFSRECNFNSINIDLVYGLPHQTVKSFSETLELILKLNPDRIALFHYAHLPQIMKHQAKYIPDGTLPSSKTKMEIFKLAVQTLSGNGYVFIGLDHFAKPEDELARARKDKTLHRNFQGYTTKSGCDLFGFGITAISCVQETFSQNIKKLNPYYEAISLDTLPLYRGIALSRDDSIRKEIIMKILCHGVVLKADIEKKFKIRFNDYFIPEMLKMRDFEKDNLVKLNNDSIEVTDIGNFFLRNIASAFDFYLQKNNGKQTTYSKTV